MRPRTSSNSAAFLQSIERAIARRLMFLRVVLEIVPEVVGERVFLRHVRVEDARELRTFGGEFRELERAPRFESDEEDALTMLRHDALGIDDFPIHLVAERVGQGVVDDFEGAALVVPDEMLHVLQHEGGWLVVVEDVGDGEEEVALFHVLEAVLASEAVLLGDASQAERLTGKACKQKIMGRDVLHGYLRDVPRDVIRVGEVRLVGPHGMGVPLGGEYAPPVQ